MTKIKICGIMREETCDTLNGLLPDYAGFIFAQKSRRYITPETALKFRERLDKRIQTVGVFLNEDIGKICEIARSGAINAIQLHGNEKNDYVERVKEAAGLTVIKAITVRSGVDIISATDTKADILLLDNGCGTGESFDWDYLEDVDRLYFLAGGLTPENVGGAVQKYTPYGVDVSSGVETDGAKDDDKIRRFIEAARAAGSF